MIREPRYKLDFKFVPVLVRREGVDFVENCLKHREQYLCERCLCAVLSFRTIDYSNNSYLSLMLLSRLRAALFLPFDQVI